MAVEDFNQIKDVVNKLDSEKPSRFGYTEDVLSATGEAEVNALEGNFILGDATLDNSIPEADQVGMSSYIVDRGLRTQASTVSRMALNHFFGRIGLNLLKLTEKTKLLINEHLVHRYITPSGEVMEKLTMEYEEDQIKLIQHRSPLDASAPITSSAAISLLPAVSEGNPGLMTGADKKVLDDLGALDFSDDSDVSANVVSNGYIYQKKNWHITETHSYVAVTDREAATELECFNTFIVTKAANSEIELDFNLSLEADEQLVFILERSVDNKVTWTEIGSAPQGLAVQQYGLAVMNYDYNHDSTIGIQRLLYTDTPEAPANTVVHYRLKIYYGGSTSGTTLYVNRTKGDNDAQDERVTSHIALAEQKSEVIAEQEVLLASSQPYLAQIQDSIDVLRSLNCILQVVQNHVIDPYSYSYTTDRTLETSELSCLTTSLTTKNANSSIRVRMSISCEAHHDGVFILERSTDDGANWTEIGGPNSADAGARRYGIKAIIYDNNYSGTPEQVNIDYIDEDLAVDIDTTVKYRLRVYGNNATSMTINKTVTDTDSVSYERTTSSVILEEIAKTPSFNEMQLYKEEESLVTEVSNKIEEFFGSSVILQMKQQKATEVFSVASSTDRTSETTEITPLSTSLTTKKNNSSIRIEFNINYEAHYNGVFILERSIDDGTTWTELGTPDLTGAGAAQRYGIATFLYDTTQASTMTNSKIDFIDELAADANTLVKYRLRFYAESGSFFLNQVYAESSLDHDERVISTVTVTEIAPVTTVSEDSLLQEEMDVVTEVGAKIDVLNETVETFKNLSISLQKRQVRTGETWFGTTTTDRDYPLIITPLLAEITPVGNYSDIEFEVYVHFECAHDTVLFPQRSLDGGVTWTDVQLHDGIMIDPSARNYGILSAGYETNDDSTPSSGFYKVIDKEVSVLAGTAIQYRLCAYSAAASTFALNRSIADTDNTENERGFSNIILTELASDQAQDLIEIAEAPSDLVAEVGEKIDAFFDSSVIVQVKDVKVTSKQSYLVTADRANAIEIACFSLSITTKTDNARVQLSLMLNAESDANQVYFFERSVDGGATWTEFGSNTDAVGSRRYGMFVMPYDSELDSTPANVKVEYLDDEINALKGTEVMYRLRCYGTAGWLAVNGTYTTSDSVLYERAISTFSLTEVKDINAITSSELAVQLDDTMTEAQVQIDRLDALQGLEATITAYTNAANVLTSTIIADKTITASDGLRTIFVNAVNADVLVKLPRKADSLHREIMIKKIAGAYDVIIRPHDDDLNTIGSYGNEAFGLYDIGNCVEFKESQTSGKWETVSLNFTPTYHIRDEKTSGTAGGASVVGGGQARELNTENKATIHGASLSSNQVTLPAGRYRVVATAPFYRTLRTKLSLYNVTDTAIDISGLSAYQMSGGETVFVPLQGELEIIETKVYELQYYCAGVQVSNGLGIETNDGNVEIYADVYIEKLA